MDPALDASLVTQSLNYHGQQLQKTWEGERGEDDLVKIGVKSSQLDFAVYQSRQKHLTFQDRGKRLKLHQFIAKEANVLFDSTLNEEVPTSSSFSIEASASEHDLCALMPPFETFLNIDKSARLRHFFENVKTGDLIIAAVMNRTPSGIWLKVLCTAGPNPRYVADINVKAYLPIANIIPAVDKKNVTRNYLINDTVCCEVLEVIPDTDKMVCGMKGVTRGVDDPPPKPALGLLSTDDFPVLYKKSVEMKGESYEAVLEKSSGFNNPNSIQYLSEVLGLANMHCSNIPTLRGGFPLQDYAEELRQAQASKWAFRSVAEGIEHFKAGRHSEAFQCLNKALSIDPRNVEGLVARGALYANSGTFKKAIEDFETSLKLNPNHANARKYMGETLVALGRSYEDENKIAEAQKAYEDCLAIIPFHEEAQNSLDFLKSKTQAPKPLIEPAELLLPGLATKTYEMKETLKQLLNLTEKKDKKKKGKKKKGKKRRSSSSSMSSSESSSSSSSSDSSSSDTDSSDSDGASRKKKRRSKSTANRARSLSPLSKRMAAIGGDDSLASFNHPYGYVPPPEPQPMPSQADVDYENKVRKFLEMTKEDSDYEEKVRNFLEETARYKRDRKMQELAAATAPISHEKAKKRKKKESKKSKKESKKKKKEREREEKRKAKLARNANSEYAQQSEKKSREQLSRKEVHDDKMRSKSHMSSEAEYDRKAFYKRQDLGEMELEPKVASYYNEDLSSPEADKPRWKMQMNQSKSTKREGMKKGYKEKGYAFDDSSDESSKVKKDVKKLSPVAPPADKNLSVRRAMALREPPPAQPPKPPPEPTPVRKGNVVLDKFGSFRLAQEGETPMSVQGSKPENFIARIQPSNASPRRQPRSPPSPASSKSRSRSRPRKYRTPHSGSRSRSNSSASRSRSGSYYSRSRSRSGSRDRSWSRSRSADRYRRSNRRGWARRGGGWDRGTYYRPRQPWGRGRGRGNNNFRDDRRFDNQWRDYRQRGSPRGFRPRRGGNNRGRPFRGGFRDFRRRYSRSRSPDRRRSRSYSRDKDREDSYSRYSDHRSDGEYEEERYVDRKEYDGKWAADENKETAQPAEPSAAPAVASDGKEADK